VQLDSVAASGGAPAVSASSSTSARYPATNVLDGNPNTRWAARGTNHWLQFQLAPAAVVQNIGLAWYQPEKRRAQFDVYVSDDGAQWKPVKNLRRSANSVGLRARVEFPPATGQAHALVERSFRVNVGAAGSMELAITPVEGKVALSGAIIEPARLEPSTRP
jgi:hypothetical protein